MRRTVWVVLFSLLLIGCFGCCTSSSLEGNSLGQFGPGGFKIVDGPRGIPSTVYLTKEIHYLAQERNARTNATFDASDAERFGISNIESDRAGGQVAIKSQIDFVPMGAKVSISLHAGSSTDRQFSVKYLPSVQFQAEAARWFKILQGRNPINGIELWQFESETK